MSFAVVIAATCLVCVVLSVTLVLSVITIQNRRRQRQFQCCGGDKSDFEMGQIENRKSENLFESSDSSNLIIATGTPFNLESKDSQADLADFKMISNICDPVCSTSNDFCATNTASNSEKAGGEMDKALHRLQVCRVRGEIIVTTTDVTFRRDVSHGRRNFRLGLDDKIVDWSEAFREDQMCEDSDQEASASYFFHRGYGHPSEHQPMERLPNSGFASLAALTGRDYRLWRCPTKHPVKSPLCLHCRPLLSFQLTLQKVDDSGGVGGILFDHRRSGRRVWISSLAYTGPLTSQVRLPRPGADADGSQSVVIQFRAEVVNDLDIVRDNTTLNTSRTDQPATQGDVWNAEKGQPHQLQPVALRESCADADDEPDNEDDEVRRQTSEDDVVTSASIREVAISTDAAAIADAAADTAATTDADAEADAVTRAFEDAADGDADEYCDADAGLDAAAASAAGPEASTAADAADLSAWLTERAERASISLIPEDDAASSEGNPASIPDCDSVSTSTVTEWSSLHKRATSNAASKWAALSMLQVADELESSSSPGVGELLSFRSPTDGDSLELTVAANTGDVGSDEIFAECSSKTSFSIAKLDTACNNVVSACEDGGSEGCAKCSDEGGGGEVGGEDAGGIGGGEVGGEDAGGIDDDKYLHFLYSSYGSSSSEGENDVYGEASEFTDSRRSLTSEPAANSCTTARNSMQSSTDFYSAESSVTSRGESTTGDYL